MVTKGGPQNHGRLYRQPLAPRLGSQQGAPHNRVDRRSGSTCGRLGGAWRLPIQLSLRGLGVDERLCRELSLRRSPTAEEKTLNEHEIGHAAPRAANAHYVQVADAVADLHLAFKAFDVLLSSRFLDPDLSTHWGVFPAGFLAPDTNQSNTLDIQRKVFRKDSLAMFGSLVKSAGYVSSSETGGGET